MKATQAAAPLGRRRSAHSSSQGSVGASAACATPSLVLAELEALRLAAKAARDAPARRPTDPAACAPLFHAPGRVGCVAHVLARCGVAVPRAFPVRVLRKLALGSRILMAVRDPLPTRCKGSHVLAKGASQALSGAGCLTRAPARRRWPQRMIPSLILVHLLRWTTTGRCPSSGACCGLESVCVTRQAVAALPRAAQPQFLFPALTLLSPGARTRCKRCLSSFTFKPFCPRITLCLWSAARYSGKLQPNYR